jgi:FkbM family methyltransferase
MDTYFKNVSIPDNITHVKIDVGLGMYNINSTNWLCNESDLFVFMFDPNSDSISSSVSSMRDRFHISDNHYTVFPIALSNVDEPTTMDFYSMEKDGGTSSLFQPIDKNLGPVKQISSVPVYSLKHFFDHFPWNRFEYIEYIKIDAQGADLDIIKSAGAYLKERVAYITAEPENSQYENCSNNTADNMEKYLITQDFIRIQHPNTKDPTFVNKKFSHLNPYIYQIG